MAGQSSHLLRIYIGAENNIMKWITCFSRKGDQPNFISSNLLPTHHKSKISEEVQRSVSSVSEERLKVKGNITVILRMDDLPTTVLCTIVKTLTIDVLITTVFTDEHIIAIIAEEHKVTV